MKDKLIAVVAILSLFCVVSLAIYSELVTTEKTLIINLHDNEDPFEVFPQILSEEKITSIKTLDLDRNEYRLVIKSRKKNFSLLDNILRNKKVKNARFD